MNINKTRIKALSFVALIAVALISCSKIVPDQSLRADWVYSKIYYFCDNGENTFRTINPNDSLGIQSATIIRSGSREKDVVFHLYLNDELSSIQRFSDSKEATGENYSTVSDNSTVVRYFGNPEDENAELVFSRWDEPGNPQNGYYFSFEFPFQQHYGVPCDTLIVNFFQPVDE